MSEKYKHKRPLTEAELLESLEKGLSDLEYVNEEPYDELDDWPDSSDGIYEE